MALRCAHTLIFRRKENKEISTVDLKVINEGFLHSLVSVNEAINIMKIICKKVK